LLGHRSRDLDEGAAAELARLHAELRRHDATTVANDPAATGRLTATWLASSGHPIWLHLDVDVLDPDALPVAAYPQPEGLDWDQLAEVMRPAAQSPA
jgi:arginase